MDTLIKVGVILGPSDARPYCYWKDLLKNLDFWDIQYHLDIDDHPNWSAYHVAIINWDIANDSPSYPAKVLKYFRKEARRPLVSWIQQGGLLFCEIQSQFGVPCQESYDEIFGKDTVTVLGEDKPDQSPGSKIVSFLKIKLFKKRGDKTTTLHIETRLGTRNYENLSKQTGCSTRGSIIQVNKRYQAHPLAYGISPFLQCEFGFANEPILPAELIEEREFKFSLYYRCPEILYSGWFTDWEFGWIPVLLEGQSGKWPVLLVRLDEKGAWIASTLRITSPSLIPLVRNLVNFKIHKEKWKEYHDQIIKQRRRTNRVVLTLAVIGSSLAVGILWQLGALIRVAEFGYFVMGLLGIGVFSILAILINMLRNYLNRHFH